MDIESYRLNERLATAAIPSWRMKALHRPHVFYTHGFPVHVASTDELMTLLDTMQEGLFAPFVRELGGFDEVDQAAFVDALVDYCLFFRVHFPHREAPLPLSTMLAHFVLAKKLRGIGSPYRILEIGPGCGYLSFFLHRWSDLDDYTQIETTESFYILQNLVNKYLFEHRFRDFAPAVFEPGQVASMVSDPKGAPLYTEVSPRVAVDVPPKCRHFPWWRIGEVANETFNIVTTNATLNEFSNEALRQYVWLIDKCLARDGCLLVQCYGGGPGSLETIFKSLFEIRLAPVVVSLEAEVTVAEKHFAKSNLLFVRERHPMFAKYAQMPLQLPRFDPANLMVKSVYVTAGSGPRRTLSADDIVAMVAERLKEV